MNCNKCGFELSGSDKFCSKCGEPTNSFNTSKFRQHKKLWLIISLILVIVIVFIIFSLSNKSPVSENEVGISIAKWAQDDDQIINPDALKIKEIVCYQPLNEDGSIKNTQYAIKYTLGDTAEGYRLIFVENNGIINKLTYDYSTGYNAEYAQVYLQRYKDKEKGYFKLNPDRMQKSYNENISK